MSRPSVSRRQAIDGVMLLDKPLGMSSNALLQKVKWLLQAEKAGHTGSLDPLASGVLPLCFGEATKFAQYLLDSDKTYVVEMILGQRSTTLDAEGELSAPQPWPELSDTEVEAVLQRFRGEQEQIPPMYSALKRDGVPLYRLARRGEEVERAPRQVSIHELCLRSRQDERWVLQVHCSKGTYIRSLVDDIGQYLGCGAYVSALRRIGVGPYQEADACSLPTLLAAHERGESLRPHLLPVDSALQGWPRLAVCDEFAYNLQRGQRPGPVAAAAGLYAVYRAQTLIGIARVDAAGQLRAERMLRTDREMTLP